MKIREEGNDLSRKSKWILHEGNNNDYVLLYQLFGSTV